MNLRYARFNNIGSALHFHHVLSDGLLFMKERFSGYDMVNTNFTVMAKPVSDRCNLKCEYCFYLGTKDALSDKPMDTMSDETLEAFICKYIQESPTPQVNFVWQGGEPTLAGLDFFVRVVELQKQHAAGKVITNALQTNGIALNKSWVEFLKANHFLVGISLDGTQAAHDQYRISTSGKGTYQAVKDAIKLLNDYQVEYNVLCTVNSANFNKGKSVYNNLKSIGVRYIQFIPIVTYKKNTPVGFTVPEKGFGKFLLDVFKEWVEQDIGFMFVMNFESSLSYYANGHALICFNQKQCGAPLVIESNGDLYSCDHFVEDRFKVGNIMQHSFAESIQSNQHKQFLTLRNVSRCGKCEYLDLCNGGCPNHTKPNGENHLCQSYKLFFKQTEGAMRYIVNNIL